MTREGLLPAERLTYAIKGLNGWYAALTNAEDAYFESTLRRGVGTTISSVLIAAGEESVPIYVSGRLDESYSGSLLLVYQDMILTVDVDSLASDQPSHVVRLWPLASVSAITVKARRSYYDGVDKYPRHHRFSFSFVLGEQRFELSSSAELHQSELVQESALFEAFQLLRARINRA